MPFNFLKKKNTTDFKSFDDLRVRARLLQKTSVRKRNVSDWPGHTEEEAGARLTLKGTQAFLWSGCFQALSVSLHKTFIKLSSIRKRNQKKWIVIFTLFKVHKCSLIQLHSVLSSGGCVRPLCPQEHRKAFRPTEEKLTLVCSKINHTG